MRGHFHRLYVPPGLLERHAHGDELLANARGVRALDVALCQRDDVFAIRRHDVRRRLPRLGHHPVVRRAHEHGDVRDTGAAFAHRAEGGVSGGIQESELAAAGTSNDEGSEVLGDAASFARRHGRGSKRVQQGGLAVVDVAHDRDHRAARGMVRGGFGVGGDADDVDVAAQLGGDELEDIRLERLLDARGGLAEVRDDRLDAGGWDAEQARELRDGGSHGGVDHARGGRGCGSRSGGSGGRDRESRRRFGCGR